MCGLIRPIAARTGVTVLQHPRERHHPFNTARLARMALRSLDLHVAWPDGDDRMVCRPPLPEGAALLYPRTDAVLLGDAAPPPSHIVVLDGTWPQARRLYRENPWLSELPHVALDPERPSRYRIRREPALHCLSTLESIVAALGVLEPELPGLEGALDAFVAMVDVQAGESAARISRFRTRTRPSRVQRLADGWDRLVVAYAEERGGVWAAVRPSTGDVVQGTADEIAAAWPSFAGRDALVACWSDRAARELAGLTGAEVLPLRPIYGNLRGGIGGTLDVVVAREGLKPAENAVEGRAGERLGNAVALAGWLAGVAFFPE